MSQWDFLLNMPVKRSRKVELKERHAQNDADVLQLAKDLKVVHDYDVQQALQCSNVKAKSLLNELARKGKLKRIKDSTRTNGVTRTVVCYTLP